MTPTRFRECLDAIGWSQRGLAEKLGIHETRTRRMAAGRHEIAANIAAWLERLARVHEAHPAPDGWDAVMGRQESLPECVPYRRSAPPPETPPAASPGPGNGMSDPELSAKFSIGAWRDKYGFGQMRVGESVSVEGYNDGNRLRLAAAAYRQNHPEWRYRSERTNVDWEGGKPPGMVVTRIG